MFASSAWAQANANLAGVWKGGYIAAQTEDANTFDVTIRGNGASFSGSVAGDGSVRFVKTYDGSGGQSHSVTYVGKLDPNGRRIRGSFRAGDVTGSFEMVR